MTRCACKGAELSCIIGNIFTELRPPCDMCGGEAVTIRGITPTGHEATITLTAAGFDFEGCAEDTALLQRIRKARCIYAGTREGAQRAVRIQCDCEGTHFGLERLEGFMRRFYRVRGVDGWVLKCDISKYFYNIKHDALKSLIRKYISDPDCLWLLDMIIDSTEGNVGIPIGNQSSQLFALLYLSSLDHMIKEKLGIKFYGRYMDDFYLIHEDKEYLRYCWKEIERHVNELGLSLNAKTNIYPLKNGIDFLGFHSYLTESGAVIRKVRRKSKNNARRRLTKMRGLLEAGKITPEKVEQSYKSWRGHASKGNCYHLIRNMDQHYNKLFGQYAAAGNRGGVAVSEEKEEGKECRKS